jgi:DNA-binding transcriptional ArsR family regulator
VGGDWFLDKIDAVEQAAKAARAALGRVPEVLEPARADRIAGQPLTQIAQQLTSTGREARLDTIATYREYEHAVFELRAAVVRALVDEEGVTLSQLAQAMGVTRQTVARPYRAGGASE